MTWNGNLVHTTWTKDPAPPPPTTEWREQGEVVTRFGQDWGRTWGGAVLDTYPLDVPEAQ